VERSKTPSVVLRSLQAFLQFGTAFQPRRPDALQRQTRPAVVSMPVTALRDDRTPFRSAKRLHAQLCGLQSQQVSLPSLQPTRSGVPFFRGSPPPASAVQRLLRARPSSHDSPCGSPRRRGTDASNRHLLPTASTTSTHASCATGSFSRLASRPELRTCFATLRPVGLAFHDAEPARARFVGLQAASILPRVPTEAEPVDTPVASRLRAVFSDRLGMESPRSRSLPFREDRATHSTRGAFHRWGTFTRCA
jgi:hypothetical protein